MAVRKPMQENPMPIQAIRLYSDFLLNIPNNTPTTPRIVPKAGINPTHKLSIPKAIENKA